MSVRFRIRFWSSFFTVIGLAILLSLGTWQAKRYLSKIELEEARDARMHLETVFVEDVDRFLDGELDFRTVHFEGTWDRERLFLIKHRVYRGQPGFWVVNALHLPGAGEQDTAVLVNRGWIPFQDSEARALRLLEELPEGPVSIYGLVHLLEYVVPDRPLRQRLEESPHPTGVIELDSYDTEAMNLALPVPTLARPIVVTRGAGDIEDAYPHASFDHITEPYLTAETHFGYALTWYLLALALIAIWIAQGMGILTSQAYEPKEAPKEAPKKEPREEPGA